MIKRALAVHVAAEMCKMTPFPTSNQTTLIKDKFLGDHVFYTLGHFCKTNEYNDIGWLLLTSGESRRYKDA